MSDAFPVLAMLVASNDSPAEKQDYRLPAVQKRLDRRRTHAVPSALSPGYASTLCGLRPIETRFSGMTMEQVRQLPRFDDAANKCGSCAMALGKMERG